MNLFKIFILILAVFGFFGLITVYPQNKESDIKNHYELITYYFPDKELALLVAEKLNKNINDKTTLTELSNIKGEFVVGPCDVLSLEGIGYLTGIDVFSCYKNNVTKIPPEIGKLTQLKYLDLRKAYSLVIVPPEIGKLIHLKKFHLYMTQVNLIPKEIENLKELEVLWISCNQLSEIPSEIGSLKSLIALDVHSNEIKTVPEEICNLKSLKSLDLSCCELKELPKDIGNLKELETLNLFRNDLKKLPPSIIKLENLSDLNVYDNYNLDENYKKYLPKLLKKN